MAYRWLLLAHVASVIVFLMMHTVQIVIAYFWPRFEAAAETSTADWLITSVRRPSFVALGAVIATGLLLVALSPRWLGAAWVWISIGLIILLAVGKWIVVGRKWIGRVNILGAAGIGGVLVLLWLMILKPF
jgi:hypothetical protein